MIWIIGKDKQSLDGYVPILKKTYDEAAIREMSKHHCYKDWSTLSTFVMKIQCIDFESIYDMRTNKDADYRIIDITTDFNYECFWYPNDCKLKRYESQIFDVFQNLTLLKIDTFYKEELIEYFCDMDFNYVENVDFAKILFNFAQNTTNNLKRIIDVFEKNGYISDKDSFFQNLFQNKKLGYQINFIQRRFPKIYLTYLV